MHASPDTLSTKSVTRTSATLHLVTAGIGRWVWVLAAIGWIAAMALPQDLLAGNIARTALFVVVVSALRLSMPRVMWMVHGLHCLRVPRAALPAGAVLIALPAVLLAGPALVVLWRQPGMADLAAIGIVLSWVTLSAALTLLPNRLHAWLVPLGIVPLLNLDTHWLALALAWSATVLGAGLAVWRWRSLLRQEQPPMHPARSTLSALSYADAWPIGLDRFTQRQFFWSGLSRLRRRGRTSPQLDAAGPCDLRAFLGEPFLPQPWWRRALGWLWGLALLAVLLTIVRHSHWTVEGAGILVGLVASVVLSIGMRGQRQLLYVFRRANGETAELALVPGLGDSRRQRAMLDRTVLGPPLVKSALAAFIALLTCAWAGASGLVLALLAAASMLAVMLGALALRQAIAPTISPSRWMRSPRLRALWLLAWLLAIATMVALSAQWLGPAPDAGRTSALIVFALLWLGALAAMARAIARHVRHARRLPHPFVQR
ncbi:hypothetical protein [Metallibacterium sp.]|uniref:hypothetical protein n=1 Tax=Metallibacterium sp. TaxID=2940281 RepID=UPI002634D1D7|nr:hypothetical protein [Metallibacterium sp.]